MRGVYLLGLARGGSRGFELLRVDLICCAVDRRLMPSVQGRPAHVEPRCEVIQHTHTPRPVPSIDHNTDKIDLSTPPNPRPHIRYTNQPGSRHRQVSNLFDQRPKVSPNAFVAPSATVVGEVELWDKVSVWYGAVIRGTWFGLHG